MVELSNFYPPKLPIGNGTSLGSVLSFLADDLKSSIQKTTAEEKGDWKPIVFLFTDGNPTDDYESAFENWNQKHRRSVNLVAISLGNNADIQVLGKITENVLLLKNTDPESFKKFFKWVTASIKTNSVSVSESNSDELQLAPITNGYLSKIDLEKHTQVRVDENFAIFSAKCQTTGRPYLIKYQKRLSESLFVEMPMKVLDYRLVGAYPVDDTYFELTDNVSNKATINTSELVGFPTCPCCGNQYGFSYCSCGSILCTGEESVAKCPWCKMESHFSFDKGHANITRTKG
jgi:uncharacterized protein YegL